ncbi:hypothetical protein PAPYR_6099 [Paratrimastix pyriformis]|uniref:BRCT domain-containing protein n=1 Tax=Paratrimastix pyriformis TaxID=342808 RepID=A0ABQ8UHK0_9EUKA|nr:hypothetical protein PAPYR_6099 [Paratrimastix pyriformis]
MMRGFSKKAYNALPPGQKILDHFLRAGSPPIPSSKKDDLTEASFYSERFARLSSQGPQVRTQIFRGCSVYFSGVTTESSSLSAFHLGKLIRLGGGTTHPYYSASITHVIGATLATSKMKAFVEARRAPFLIRAEWVLDSVKACRRLPEREYAINPQANQVPAWARAAKPSAAGAAPPPRLPGEEEAATPSPSAAPMALVTSMSAPASTSQMSRFPPPPPGAPDEEDGEPQEPLERAASPML